MSQKIIVKMLDTFYLVLSVKGNFLEPKKLTMRNKGDFMLKYSRK